MRFRRQISFLLIVAIGIIALRVVVFGHLPPYGKMLAQVGIAVGVAPNPYNTLDAQLNLKQQQLDAEQGLLEAQKAALASTTAANAIPAATDWYLIIAVIALSILLGINFYLDWRRRKNEVIVEPVAEGKNNI